MEKIPILVDKKECPKCHQKDITGDECPNCGEFLGSPEEAAKRVAAEIAKGAVTEQAGK